ncbi:MAG: cupredoxin domain-containing protein [Candidatus Portnoybacteria bacterium]|nr:cupredoxin domain-containing protein [Candidatus Portnoybacteria bacterium]
MKNRLILIIVLVALTVGAAFAIQKFNKNEVNQVPLTEGSEQKIIIMNFKFDPAVLKVPRNTKIIWQNEDAVNHTVTGEGWDSGEIICGAIFEKTFIEKGSYSYRCDIHPDMTGEIIVE